ncbi:MAG TPA: metallophosphoesterase [Candidatus Kapabacteria bacterium]|nr:metallophosphoesterase [Candidatus Kapabacteria bacterium]HPO62600.1 metallophosphoesterase [Candidatus Kapabacteria bacterium]
MNDYLPYIIGGVFIFLLLDFYFLKSWTKYIKNQNYNPFLYRIFWFFSVSMIVLFVYLSIKRFSSEHQDELSKILYTIEAVWFIPKLVIVPILIFKDFFKFIYKKLKINYKSIFPKKKEPAAVYDESKRKFIQNATWGLAGVPFLLVTDGLIRTTNNFKIHYVEIPIFNLPSQLNGFRIVQISDIHAGGFFDKEPIIEAKRIINLLKPDIITITGDYVNFNPNELNLIITEISQLSANYGVFGCLGNHDHYMNDENHNKLQTTLKNAGIDLLINENRKINVQGSELQIIGVDNIGHGQSFGDIDLAVKNIEFAKPTVLLLHDPTYWEEKIISKYPVDLTLSGHTHGGQIGFNMFGVEASQAMFFYKRWAGLHQIKENYLYINRGLGTTGPPIRVGINPEITLLTLKSLDNLA